MLDQIELKQRYNEYLREVAQEQLYQQAKANRAGRNQPMLLRLGDMLIAAGNHLKTKTDFQQV